MVIPESHSVRGMSVLSHYNQSLQDHMCDNQSVLDYLLTSQVVFSSFSYYVYIFQLDYYCVVVLDIISTILGYLI